MKNFSQHMLLRSTRKSAWHIKSVFLILLVAFSIVPCAYADVSSTDRTDTAQRIERRPLSDLKLPIYVWTLNENRPRAVLVCLHGAVLHGSSFQPLGLAMAPHNYMTVAIDLRGYGKWYHCNFGSKKDRTFRYKDSLNDVRILLARLRKDYPGVPIYCLGESLGANMSMLIAARMPDLVDGVIAVSPFTSLKPYVSPRVLLYIIQVAASPQSKLDLSFYLRSRLAHNKATIIEHLNDPLNRDRQSLSELCSSLRLLLEGKRAARYMDSRIPVLFVAGAKDRIVYTSGIKRLFRRLPASDKELIVEPEIGHLMVETSEQEPQVITAIVDWIGEHTAEFAMQPE